MDSDGCISKVKAQSIYVSTEKQLALDVSELLWSLGIKNSMTQGPSLRYGKPTGRRCILSDLHHFLIFSQAVSKATPPKNEVENPTRSLFSLYSRHRAGKRKSPDEVHSGQFTNTSVSSRIFYGADSQFKPPPLSHYSNLRRWRGTS